MRRFVVAFTLVVLTAAVACTRDGSSDPSSSPVPGGSVSPTTTPTSVVSEPTSSPTPPAIPNPPPPTTGSASETCVNGWATPAAGTPPFTEPLGIVRRTTGVEGELVVVDMRRFTGPESPPTDKGYLLDVERWYLKLYARDDPSFQGRFLVEARRFGRGLVAVAPYDTAGFRSPDWRGFQFDSSHTGRRHIPGLPGTWSGIEYDFVEGGEGLTIPGLPESVVGCLDGA